MFTENGVKFVPDNWKPREEDIALVMERHNITRQEADRQLEELRDYEFKRDYTDFNRVYRNWFRTADKYKLLNREHKPRIVEEVTEEDLVEDRRKWAEDMKRFKRN